MLKYKFPPFLSLQHWHVTFDDVTPKWPLAMWIYSNPITYPQMVNSALEIDSSYNHKVSGKLMADMLMNRSSDDLQVGSIRMTAFGHASHHIYANFFNPQTDSFTVRNVIVLHFLCCCLKYKIRFNFSSFTAIFGSHRISHQRPLPVDNGDYATEPWTMVQRDRVSS